MARNRRRDQDGAVALEFGLLLPVLVMLIFGIVQFGLALHTTQALQAAGHEGARLGALPGTTVEEIVDRLQGSLAPLADDGDWTATCPPPDGKLCWSVAAQGGAAYSDVTARPCSDSAVSGVVVAVEAPRTIAIPFFGDPRYLLSGTGEFRCER